MPDKILNYKIILASRSPRRQQILKEMGFIFTVREMDFDESYPPGLTGEKIAEYISRKKALALKDDIKTGELVITADTVVWNDGVILGKPADNSEAAVMLRAISGKTHEVITGVTLVSSDKMITFTDVTKVTFGELTEDEIKYYVDNFNPVDKAGAYGIQEWIGLTGCSRIDGSYFNVVGLPASRLYTELKNF